MSNIFKASVGLFMIYVGTYIHCLHYKPRSFASTTIASNYAYAFTPNSTEQPYFMVVRPGPALGASIPTDQPFPYSSTFGQPADFNYSGISYRNLAVAADAWSQVKHNAGIAGNDDGTKVFAKQVIYTLLVWHPEYSGAFSIKDPKSIWTDAALDGMFDALAKEFDSEMVALFTNKTNVGNRIFDDYAYTYFVGTMNNGGKVWRTLAYFCWLTDAMQAATEFFLGDQLCDDAYMAIAQCYDFINIRSYHAFDLYWRQCSVRATLTDFPTISAL